MDTGVRLGPRLRHLLDSLPDEVYVADPDSLQLLAANPRAQENLGYSPGQLELMALPRLCARMAPETLRDHIARLREGATDIVEFRSWHSRANGTRYEVNSRLSLWSGEGPAVLLLVVQPAAAEATRPDATLREDRIDFLATHDMLTGLPSRPLFMQRLQEAIDAPGVQPLAVVQLALSDFGDINQEYGYETGDRLLKSIAAAVMTSRICSSGCSRPCPPRCGPGSRRSRCRPASARRCTRTMPGRRTCCCAMPGWRCARRARGARGMPACIEPRRTPGRRKLRSQPRYCRRRS
jgi:PAS domain S-box-containing protein